MIKTYISILFLSLTTLLFAQVKKPSESIADCDGAMNIFKSGNYTLQFTGTAGAKADLAQYPSLTDLSDNNMVWVNFIPEYDGTLNFDAEIKQDYLQMVIFEEGPKDICYELAAGSAEIKRLHIAKNLRKVGLNSSIDDGILFSLRIKAGSKILIGFSTADKSKATIQLDFRFKEDDSNLKAANETKLMDLRKDEFAPTLKISVRDASTKGPVISNLTIEGFKELTATYKGSDFLFNVSRSGKGFIKCDAEGYFFLDQEVAFIHSEDQEITLFVESLGKGKSMQIEEIEFQPGTSEFLQGSESKLRRLRDFMALNSEVSIEIQGHVHATNESNGFAAQKLSEARAKRVLIYLASQGIDKSRMEAVGYGNTKPIYPKPKFAYEEQANRRVEIVIK
jgi:outer membrane protein OmpA-like peptidoglycan-associated protein